MPSQISFILAESAKMWYNCSDIIIKSYGEMSIGKK